MTNEPMDLWLSADPFLDDYDFSDEEARHFGECQNHILGFNYNNI